KRAVNVTGLFLERGTGKPVPGVSVTLIELGGKRHGSQTVKTDNQGRYTFQCLPGKVRVSTSFFPVTHVSVPTQRWEDFTVPDAPKGRGRATREAPPAAPPLRGQVVDESGHAVAGAAVQATWTLPGVGGSSSGAISVITDEKGGFALHGLGPDSNVS